MYCAFVWIFSLRAMFRKCYCFGSTRRIEKTLPQIINKIWVVFGYGLIAYLRFHSYSFVLLRRVKRILKLNKDVPPKNIHELMKSSERERERQKGFTIHLIELISHSIPMLRLMLTRSRFHAFFSITQNRWYTKFQKWFCTFFQYSSRIFGWCGRCGCGRRYDTFLTLTFITFEININFVVVVATISFSQLLKMTALWATHFDAIAAVIIQMLVGHTIVAQHHCVVRTKNTFGQAINFICIFITTTVSTANTMARWRLLLLPPIQMMNVVLEAITMVIVTW